MFLFMICTLSLSFFFFFNDTATTEIYTLSLHDALPISFCVSCGKALPGQDPLMPRVITESRAAKSELGKGLLDRKSTRLNSSHSQISYAVFCLKKKKKTEQETRRHQKQRMNEIEHERQN